MASDRLRRDTINKLVILDASAIMMPFEFKIDLEEELNRLLGSYRIVVPKPIVLELKRLSEKEAGRKRMTAKASLRIIRRYETVDVKEKNGDKSILKLAEKTNGVVVTNDRELRRKLKNLSMPVIFLRAKKKLVLE
jgi:hypothetical protein